MSQQDNNLSSLLRSFSEQELREVLYQDDLCFLINEEIYKKWPKAIKNNWRMGGLHKEWNGFLKNYQGINIKAPRSHLKTFFNFEGYALQRCRFNKTGSLEIRYFTGSDSLAVEKLDHIKDFAKLPYFSELLKGADINNKTELKFGNGSKIYAQGFWSKLRGGHPDILILDDIIDSQVIYSDEQNKKSKERMGGEILGMAEPDTQIIIIGTLQREDDVYSVEWGDVLEDKKIKWVNRTYDSILDEEKKITLFPEKWDWEALMAKKREIEKVIGEKWFLKEYRNFPVKLLGEIIKKDWLQWYDVLPEGLRIYTGWDLSVGKELDKGDYTACITFGIDGKGNIYIIRVFRARIDFPERLKKVVEFANIDRPIGIRIESNTFQADSVKVLIDNTALPIEGVKTTENKIKKFSEELAPLFENKKVFLKRGDEAHQIFADELCSLPRGKYDDEADAFCIGLKDVQFGDYDLRVLAF